jgi:endonuclease G
MVARNMASREASIVREAAARWRERAPEREAKEEAVGRGEYTKADSPERLAARVRRIDEWIEAAATARGPLDGALRESGRAAPAALRPEDVTDALVERKIGESRDLLSVEFFEQGLDAARCVGRVVTRGEANGTGFLVAPGLMLTNQHVLRTAEEAADSEFELDYEEQRFGPRKISQIFKLQPDMFFFNHESLDFAIVAVSSQSGDGVSLDDYGFRPLIGEEGKITIGECVNIIQHPEGREKQIVIRENKLVDLPDRKGMEQYFHYRADTEKGSSGSPVFNDQWEIVALHHSGVPKTNARGEIVDAEDRPIRERDLEARAVWVANEGVRVSRIVGALRDASLRTTAERTIRDEALALWRRQGVPSAQENAVTVRVDPTLKREEATPTGRHVGPQSRQPQPPLGRSTPEPDPPSDGTRRDIPARPRPRAGSGHDGSVELTIPLRVSVRLGDFGSDGRPTVAPGAGSR